MKGKKGLRIGSSDFKRIVGGNGYFVDKTSLIYDFFNSASEVMLMPRPRRFGKTLNLSMLEYFFDILKKEDANLFTEFEIAEHQDFCQAHQNQYPVISISLKKIKASNWEECLAEFKSVISELYRRNDFLLKSDKIKNYEKQEIESIISRTASNTDYKASLKNLSGYLYRHFEKNVIILLDEYDTSIIYAYEATFGRKKKAGNEEFYDNAIDFMRTFLGDAFKGNQYLEKGLLTGIMRIARESMFSEMNNLAVFPVTSPYFADKFGFTEAETKKILNYFDYQDDFQNVQKWYNGYKFGNIDKIYNPWSIVNYIARHEEGFKAYWVNTGSDALIKERITEANIEDELQKLISGESIDKTVSDTFVFSDFNTKEELLWTLLLHSGYLTAFEQLDRTRYKLRIPNLEIRAVFQDIILDWTVSAHKFNKDILIRTSEHLINNRLPEFEKGFQRIIGDTMSYFDTAGEAERIYHAYTLGMLAILTDDYQIKSNRESGTGRYDILMIPFDKSKNGVVIEIKQTDKRHEDDYIPFRKRINASLELAKKQIDRHKYYKELVASKIPLENIIKIPIVFAGKDPYVLVNTDYEDWD